ncbi:hypothetical protein FQN52_000043 [Onygenales sp. PD_12]|nr:hypothetical protein FQN52_000043 [Onygenales sp. PD_12]
MASLTAKEPNTSTHSTPAAVPGIPPPHNHGSPHTHSQTQPQQHLSAHGHGLLPPESTRDKQPSSSRRRPHRPKIHTHLSHYHGIHPLDDSWLHHRQPHLRHRERERERDRARDRDRDRDRHQERDGEASHNSPPRKQNQKQKDKRSKEKSKEKEKRKHRSHGQKRHGHGHASADRSGSGSGSGSRSRDVRVHIPIPIPTARARGVREHATMSLRPAKYVGKEREGEGDGMVTGQSEGSMSEVEGMERRLPFGRRRGDMMITMEDVRRERSRRTREEETNLSTLSTLSALSTSITRRLDTTYYNLLEKITSLHSAIYSLHSLLTTTSTLHTSLTTSLSSLAHTTTRQLADVHAFAPQLHQIEALEARMRGSAEKAMELNRRLEVVRGKIEAWDRREGEWQDRVSRRLRIFWAGMVGVVLVLVVAWAVEQVRPVSSASVGLGEQGGVGSSVNMSLADGVAGNSTFGAGEGRDVWLRNPFDAAGNGNGNETDGDRTCHKEL